MSQWGNIGQNFWADTVSWMVEWLVPMIMLEKEGDDQPTAEEEKAKAEAVAAAKDLWKSILDPWQAPVGCLSTAVPCFLSGSLTCIQPWR